jgi:gliding motility-associated-like protein
VKSYFANFNSLADTTFTSTGLNTQQQQYNYKIEFYSSGNLIGNTQPASSVFLNATGLARRVQLSWSKIVPWNNERYFIYKQNASLGYDLVDSTQLLSYTDTGLVNGQNYCYKILSKGSYGDPTILKPLLNWSQKACATPADNEAPCPPSVNVSGNCNSQSTSLTWTADLSGCASDAVYYNLYFKPNVDSAYVKIDSFPLAINSFSIDFSPSIAGCYFISAVDSFGNESPITQDYCIDNCPEYELPNIITLNGDSVNDFFIPVKNKFVREIELKIYNRWGNLLYETKDPKIKWNGNAQQSGLPVNDGTYYYVCKVIFIRYIGDEEIILKGFFQVINK